MKKWAGVFDGSLDKLADEFNSSLSFDKRLAPYDIQGSIAHATMLGECGIISKADADAIVAGLNKILTEVNSGIAIEGEEDIHMWVEECLTKLIGDTGKKLHTGRSRNDQVALDVRLYLRKTIDDIIGELALLISTIADIAESNLGTIIPAYTHMQKAQPTTLAHHMLAYAEMFLRDIDRLKDCRKRVNIMPLGAGACCGTGFAINRHRVAELLGFDGVTQNSLDTVSDRDFGVEFASACSLIMMHLSRYNEEIIYWSTGEFGYITLDDKFSTGSSMMPQKKNPDMSELIRGKTGRVFGATVSLLTMLKGLPLAYNKDMQEDKEAIFDCADTVSKSLAIFTAMLPSLKYNKERLYKAAAEGYTNATDCADYLVKKGLPFREAHHAVGSLVKKAMQKKKPLDKLPLTDFKAASKLFEADILEVLKIENVVKARSLVGGCSPDVVRKRLQEIKAL
ncbi:MAG: argininosuccinate lyase [Firmicutes bacterium]|nr:argininosuccinate lyase [Bacillota bacterium]